MMKAVTFAALVAAAQAALYSDHEVVQKSMWESFKAEHKRIYETEAEELKRYNVFLANLRVADERNAAERAAGGSAVHGITKFSDLTPEEFKARYTNYKPSAEKREGAKKHIPTTRAAESDSVIQADWTSVYTTPVKDQGACGSCWAFSATEQIESEAMRTLGSTYILSPQQITSCDKTAFGCGGGWSEHAYNYVKRAGGIEQESDYPYTSGTAGVTGSCKSDSSKFVVTVKDYTTVESETDMASYVGSTGPLSVCLDASSWSSYTGGIMTSCGTDVDHCVQAVGVDTGAGYWIVRNSWGTSWGESGFIRLAYGADTCAIANDPTYADVELVSA